LRKEIIGNATLYLGDCLDILPDLPKVGAIVTDPPYSSGGQYRGDRARSTTEKYVSAKFASRSEFSGDNLDQRVFMVWSSWWLSAARSVCEDGAVLCAFSDWRQIPAITDAVQCGGWVWRNLATWWKPGCRMVRGRFSSSAEYIVYASNGAHESDGERAVQNVFSCATVSGDDKEHIAEKPESVMTWVLSVTKPGCLVLDPFMGSGTTGIACHHMNRPFIGIEMQPEHFDTACERIANAQRQERLFA
jgi:site-specific DNA-methyltransferase (adenine-specific)